jgi:hypothetical protein
MNLALLWKEWREHRLIWLAVAALAVVVVGGSYLALAPAAGIGADQELREILLYAVLILAVAYGLVCGGMMFAGEQESGTQVFLDMLSGRRVPVWRGKVLIGALLTVAQVVLLLALDLAVGLTQGLPRFGGWAVVLLVYALNAYSAGLAASTFCRTALGAAGVGTLLVAGCWSVTGVVVGVLAMWASLPSGLEFLVLMALLTAVLAGVSCLTYCQLDWARRHPATMRAAASTGSVRALVWLTVRQGRGVMAVLAASGVVLAGLLPAAGMLLWPILTLLVGVVCGAAVFLPEQVGGAARFLGNQRVPLGRVWLVKTLCWLAVAVGVAVLIFVALGVRATLTAAQEGYLQNAYNLEGWLHRNHMLPLYTPAYLFLTLWLLTGFATGLLLAQVFHKTVVAGLLSLGISAALAGLWVPSLIVGGVHLWQVFGVPVLFLIVSRLIMRPWTADRLYSRWPLLGLIGCGLLVVVWTASGLTFRILEVPDVGEPFDVHAFIASLPSSKENEASRLMLAAADELREQEQKLDVEMKPPRKPLFPAPKKESVPGMSTVARQATPSQAYILQASEVLEKGWPKGEHDLDRWLDQMFEGRWATDYRAAAKAPLGVIVDPRSFSVTTRLEREQLSREAALLFVVRALQLQARGEDEAALDHLLIVLGLSRQMRNKAPSLVYLIGRAEESMALEGVRRWLNHLGPKKELLRRALRELTQHEEQTPPSWDYLKVEYFALRNALRQLPATLTWWCSDQSQPLEGRLLTLAAQTPWEKERQQRLMNLYLSEEIKIASQTDTTAARGITSWDRLAFNRALTPWAFLPLTERLLLTAKRSKCDVRAARLQVALALYELDHGRPAKSLEELVPRYLPAVPRDPFTRQPFHYRISKGEEIAESQLSGEADAESFRKVSPGQGVLWCEEVPTSSGQPAQQRYFLVPRWAKE